MNAKPEIKSIELYIAPGCPHCPNMIKMTSEMVKKGDIAKLDIINIAEATELASQVGIRSVPAFRINGVVLTGVHTAAELQDWLNKAGSEAQADYYNQAFEQGQLDEIIARLENDTEDLSLLLQMSANLETPLTSRIGISAVFEHFAGQAPLVNLLDDICHLAESEDNSVRVDMAHFLGLTQNKNALACLQKLLDDPFEDVRETAQDAVELIQDNL
ncbi:MAG: thioredoxin family protein [Gammaproteobacteria bacterium]|jgi:glutaredoxin